MTKKEVPWKYLIESFSFAVALLVLAGMLSLSANSSATASGETYSKEEIENAIHQRDQALQVIVVEIESLRERVAKLEGTPNEEVTK